MTGANPPVPKGVLYIRGGLQTTWWSICSGIFATRQLELIQTKLHINLVAPTLLLPGFREMAETERIWVTSHYSSQPRSWEFCRSQPKPLDDKNSKVKFTKTKETNRLSVPPISVLPDDVDTEEKVSNNPNNDEFFSPVEDIPHSTSSPVSSSPPPSDPLPILCRCGADSDGHRDEIKELAVECMQCHNFSHLACQTYRLSAGLTGTFKCHMCNPAMPRTQRDHSSVLDAITNGTATTRRSRRL